MCATSFLNSMYVEMRGSYIVLDCVCMAGSHLMDMPCKVLGCSPVLRARRNKELLIVLKGFSIYAEVAAKSSENTIERLMRVRIAVFFLYKLSLLVHLCFIIFECD